MIHAGQQLLFHL